MKGFTGSPRRSIRIGVWALLAVMAGACAPGGDEGATVTHAPATDTAVTGTSSSATAASPRTPTSEPPVGPTELPFGTIESDLNGDSRDALLEGILTLEGGCLLVVSTYPSTEEGGGPIEEQTALVLPDTVTWDGETLGFPGSGTTYALGDEIALGGGQTSREAAVTKFGLPESCPPAEYVWGMY